MHEAVGSIPSTADKQKNKETKNSACLDTDATSIYCPYIEYIIFSVLLAGDNHLSAMFVLFYSLIHW